MKSVDCFIIHGIGQKVDINDYLKFIDGVKSYIDKDVDLNFIQINYAEILDDRETTIWEWMSDMGNGIRKWACFYIADVIAYAPTEKNKEGDWYYDLNRMCDKIYKTSRKDAKKVVFGHSLGSQIALSLCYRCHFDALMTAGSPIIYFSVRFKDFGTPIPVKRFVNFYNNNDLVSTRVSRNPNFKDAEDIEVKPSLFFRIPFVLPLLKKLKSHTFYWGCDAVHSKVADIIKEV